MELEGYLEKQGEKFKNWKRRYFRIDERKLKYFPNANDPDYIDFIPLERNCKVRFAEGLRSGAKYLDCGFVIETTNRTYLLLAADKEDRARWIYGIREVLEAIYPPDGSSPVDSFLTTMKASSNQQKKSDKITSGREKRLTVNSYGINTKAEEQEQQQALLTLRRQLAEKESEIVDLKKKVRSAENTSADLAERYFVSLAIFTKMNLAKDGCFCNLDVYDLWEEVRTQHIAMSEWPLWVRNRIEKSLQLPSPREMEEIPYH